MKSKLLKFLSIAAVVGCSFLFGQNNTAEAFLDCTAAKCGTSGIKACMKSKGYTTFADLAAKNHEPNCAKAFTARCVANCNFDADNCPAATSQCASAEEPAATETCADDPSGCATVTKCLKAFRGGTDLTQGCKDEIKADPVCGYKSNKTTCAKL